MTTAKPSEKYADMIVGGGFVRYTNDDQKYRVHTEGKPKGLVISYVTFSAIRKRVKLARTALPDGGAEYRPN